MTGKTDVFENDILKLVFNGAAIRIEGKRDVCALRRTIAIH